MQQTKAEQAISYRLQARHNGMALRSFYRQLGRLRRNEPVIHKRGPPKTVFDHQELFAELERLPHGPRRTGGLGLLHASWRPFISRRDISELARQVRWEHRQADLAKMRRVDWLLPGSTWSFDDVHVGHTAAGDLLQHTTSVDLASNYLFEPLLGTPCCGAEIAGHLDRQCCRFGPPLFLKADMGSNLNSHEVLDVVTEHGIVLLNSPVHYPPYRRAAGSMPRACREERSVNGVVEHMNCELKRLLKADPRFRNAPDEHKEAYLADYINRLNHNERRGLNTRHACLCFGNRRTRATFSRRMRHQIIGEVQIIQEEILSDVDRPDRWHQRLAHCRACETVMLKHGLITVSRSGHVISPEQLNALPLDNSRGPNQNQLSPGFAPKKVP